MKPRTALLDDLTQALKQRAWDLCRELYFRALYGLPGDLQVRAAAAALRRYIPIFEARWRDVRWPRQLLDNPQLWVKESGRQVPDLPGLVNPADASFLFCFDALVLACSHPTNRAMMTSSCACAIDKAIQARADNVWLADDPQAVEMWRALGSAHNQPGVDCCALQNEFAGRSAEENVASIAVREREWGQAVAWLKNEGVGAYPNVDDTEALEQDLAHWKQHEMLLIVPEPEGP